ncbi:uncharacterized protein LOC144149466 [Haemaphysalis longicornis]
MDQVGSKRGKLRTCDRSVRIPSRKGLGGSTASMASFVAVETTFIGLAAVLFCFVTTVQGNQGNSGDGREKISGPTNANGPPFGAPQPQVPPGLAARRLARLRAAVARNRAAQMAASGPLGGPALPPQNNGRPIPLPKGVPQQPRPQGIPTRQGGVFN